METVEARVTGNVQGVFFRAWTKAEAELRGVSGWVRNESDGSVTALLSGERDAVREMVTALHDGPPTASVDRVETRQAAAPESAGFHILR